MKTTQFLCPLCGHSRKAAAARQWCSDGHQKAMMRPASVVRAVDALLGKPAPTTKKKKKKNSSRTNSRAAAARELPREYNREFTPEDGDAGHTFKVKRIPTPFWEQVSEKAAREGTSLRGMVLRTFRQWLQEGAA